MFQAWMKWLKPILVSSLCSFLFVATLFLTGCNSQEEKVQAKTLPAVPPGGVLLHGAGATFPSLLYKNWFAAYQQKHPETVIVYDAVGSGEGIRRFTKTNVTPEDIVDFGASDAAMTDEQIAKVPDGAMLIPMTAGAVAVAYNLPNFNGELKLSRVALAGIFSGEITNWNDPRIAKANPGVKFPDLTIATIVRQDSSGTTFAFTKHLDSISESWRKKFGPVTLVNWPGNALRAKGNEGVAAKIQQTQGSLGYVGFEFAHQLGLPVASLENREGKFVAPSATSAKASLATIQLPENLRAFVPDPTGEGSYPIVTMSWILIYRNYADPKKTESLKNLFSWCAGEGQQDAMRLGYIPLPENVASKSVAALQTLRQ